MAISPQTAAASAEVVATHKLDFPVLCDAGNAYARELGIVHDLPADLREVYGGFGIDLPADNGDDSWTLPMPTRLVVDSEGVVRWVAADPDYTQRPEPEQSVEAVKSLLEAG